MISEGLKRFIIIGVIEGSILTFLMLYFNIDAIWMSLLSMATILPAVWYVSSTDIKIVNTKLREIESKYKVKFKDED